MIDDFLTSPDDLPLVRPRAGTAVRSTATTPSPVPGTPRTAIAAGVMLAVSVIGVAPVASATAVSKTSPAAEDTR